MTCYDIAMNAILNDVSFKVSANNLMKQNSSIGQWDTILLGDMFNESDLSKDLLQWLRPGCRLGINVVIGDPGTIFQSAVNPKELKQLKHYFMPDIEVEKQGHITTEVWQFCQ